MYNLCTFIRTMKHFLHLCILLSSFHLSHGILCNTQCSDDFSLFNCTLNNPHCNFWYRSAYLNEYCTDNKPVPNLPLACIPEVRGVLKQCNTDFCNARNASCPYTLSRWSNVTCLDSLTNTSVGQWCRITQTGYKIELAAETGLPIIGDVFVNLTGSQNSICYQDSVEGITECYCYGDLCNTKDLLTKGFREIFSSKYTKYQCASYDALNSSYSQKKIAKGHYWYSWYSYRKNSLTNYSQRLFSSFLLSTPEIFQQWRGCVNYYGISRARFCYCTGDMCNVQSIGSVKVHSDHINWFFIVVAFTLRFGWF